MALSLRESLAVAVDLPKTDAVLMGRAELLAPADRDLLEAVLVHSQPTALLGRMLGVSPMAIRKRVHRLCKRITSKRFLEVARTLSYLNIEDARIARLYFCQAVPQRTLAKQLGITQHHLRRKLDHIRAEVATLHRLRAAGRFTDEPLAVSSG